MINIKSNAINRNVRVLYQLKRTGEVYSRPMAITMATAPQRLYDSVYLKPLLLPAADNSRCPAAGS